MAIYNEMGQQVIQSRPRHSIFQHTKSEVEKRNRNVFDRANEERDAGIDEANAFMAKDPYAFRQISFPSDITTNPARGHYMLFYVNVQNKTKYKHTGATDGLTVGNQVATFIKGESAAGPMGYLQDDYNAKMAITGGGFNDQTVYNSAGGKWQYDSVKAGGIGNINSSDVTYLAKGRPEGHGPTSGMEAWKPTTTRITDSIALYLPANITSDLSARYPGAEMGLIGFALASGFDFMQNWGEDDFEGAADSIKGFVGSLGKDVLVRGAAGLADAIETGANTYGSINKYFSRAINPYMEVIFENMEMRSFT